MNELIIELYGHTNIVRFFFFYKNWNICCVISSEATFFHALDLGELSMSVYDDLMSTYYSRRGNYVYLT